MEALPEGVESISNEAVGVGDLLVVQLKNGFTVVLDCLRIADHECQIGVYKPGDWNGGEGEECMIAVSFDPEVQPEAKVYKQV